MRFARQIIRCFLVFTLLLSSVSLVYAASPSTSGPLAKVIEEAKKEGKVTVYGSYTYDEGNVIHAAFNKRYPFIKFEHLSIGAGDVVTRVLMESKSGTAGADVALTGTPMFIPLVKEGFLKQIDWAALGVHSDAIDTSWGVTCATITNVLAWNTNLVSRTDTPKNWKDLLDPKWKGAIGIWVNPNPFSDLVPALGEDQVADYLKKLMQNEPVIIRGEERYLPGLQQVKFQWVWLLTPHFG